MGVAAGLRFQLGKFLLDVARLGLELGDSRGGRSLLAFQAAAFGFCLGELGGGLAQRVLRGDTRLDCLGGGGAELRLLLVAFARCYELAAFLTQSAQHAFGLGDVFFLAGEVAGGLRQPRLQFRLAGLGPGLFALQRVPFHAQAVQHRRALGFRIAQRLELLGRFGLAPQGLAFSLGLFGDRRQRLLECRLVSLDLPASGRPLQVVLQGLHLVDLVGDLPVALGLARLAAHGVELRFDLADEVGQPPEIGLGCLEAQFRLVAAAMQAGNAGGVFQHAPALLRRGVDDLADAALLDQRR